jgi:hypothetical protein
MSIITSTSSDDEVRFLVDVGIVGVEVLAVVVVEHSWLSIVLHHDLAVGTDVFA